jgi:hypothetical protein
MRGGDWYIPLASSRVGAQHDSLLVATIGGVEQGPLTSRSTRVVPAIPAPTLDSQ